MNDQYIKIRYNKHVRENDICVFGWVSVMCHVLSAGIFSIIYHIYQMANEVEKSLKSMLARFDKIWANFD